MAVRDILDSRVRKITALMALLIAIGTAVVHFFGHIEWWRALYLAAGVVTSAGIDDDKFNDAQPWVKVSAVVVQLTGIVLMALLTAVVVDSLIGARLSRIIGGVRGRPRNHVVVCGLGTVGARVLEIDGLIKRNNRSITIADWRRLRGVADFDEDYLHLREMAEPAELAELASARGA